MPIREFDHYPEHFSVEKSGLNGFAGSLVYTSFTDKIPSSVDDAPSVHRVHLDSHEIEDLILKLELMLLMDNSDRPKRCPACGSRAELLQAPNTAKNKPVPGHQHDVDLPGSEDNG